MEKESFDRARKEEEEVEKEKAMLRCPPLKKQRGRKKLDITDEEREERAKKQKRASYQKRIGKRGSAGAGGEDNVGCGGGGAVGKGNFHNQMVQWGDGETAPPEQSQIAIFQDGSPAAKGRKAGFGHQGAHNDTDTESSVGS